MPRTHADTSQAHADPQADALNGNAPIVVAAGTMTRGQVAKRLARSLATVRRWEQTGRLVPMVSADGVHRFDRQEVLALAQELQDSDDDGRKSELEVKADAVSDIVASAQAHTESAFELLIKTVTATGSDHRQLVTALLSENQRLAGEAVEHAAEMRRMRKEHQEFLDEMAERDRRDRKAEAKEKQDAAWHDAAREALKPLVPAFAGAAAKHFGLPAPEAATSTIGMILSRMPEDRRSRLMAAIFTADVFTPTDLAALQVAIEATAPKKDNAAAPVATVGVTTPPPPAPAAAETSLPAPPPPDDAPIVERVAYWKNVNDVLEQRMNALNAEGEQICVRGGEALAKLKELQALAKETKS